MTLFSPASSIIRDAINVFVHGFCFTRSGTHPYLAEQVGPLWVMRDASRRSGSYRNEEWVAYGLPAEEIDRTVREHARNRYAISAICGLDDPQEPLRAGFKVLGYRLAQIPTFDAPAAIERVQTAEQAAHLSRANRARPVPPEYFLPHSPLRQYMASTGDEVVGWVRSIQVENATWCADMFVLPPFRRRGIARAMLGRMLIDDRSDGSLLAVMLASHAGAMLYPAAGYEQIGMLLLFHPGK